MYRHSLFVAFLTVLLIHSICGVLQCHENLSGNVIPQSWSGTTSAAIYTDYQNQTKIQKPIAMAKQTKTTSTPSKSATRPTDYQPQPGNKATLSLADFTDDNIFAELRRRGYNGELRQLKVVSV